MKVAFGIAQKFIQLVAPVVASSAVAISPAQAATFSFSGSQVNLFDFSAVSTAAETFTDTDTVAIAPDGVVNTDANADANFVFDPPGAFNFSVSQESGTGQEYSGLAQSEANVVGRFFVEDEFAFNFIALLDLRTEIGDSSFESATAGGGLFFQLFDTTDENNPKLLDLFFIAGQINTPGDDDFLDFQTSPNITLSSNSIFNSSFGGNSESAFAQVEGAYRRRFQDSLFVTLVEGKGNQATVAAVPEPTTIFAIALSGTAGAVLKLRRRSSSN
ncbi:MAG: PEP-CTERM sorting domain-containing protein [Leptolyngbyaceae cyanobacterium HOT.MB2.61]|nr:PEP-CTERM sorting domain-containing protein [Leptolyngbyaceae cyanobacterium HOT.MB2.61]